MKNTVLALATLMVGSVSFADQCAFVTRVQAEKAVKALLETRTVQQLCEPCGETTAKTVSLDSVGLRKAGYKNYSEVVINEKGIDLAYTYVNGLNLAQLVGCPTQSVSSSLKY